MFIRKPIGQSHPNSTIHSFLFCTILTLLASFLQREYRVYSSAYFYMGFICLTVYVNLFLYFKVRMKDEVTTLSHKVNLDPLYCAKIGFMDTMLFATATAFAVYVDLPQYIMFLFTTYILASASFLFLVRHMLMRID